MKINLYMEIYLTANLKYNWDLSMITLSGIKHIEKNKLPVKIHLFESQELLVESLPQFNLTDDGIGCAVGKTFHDENGINIHINAYIQQFEFILFHEIGHAYLLTHYSNENYKKSSCQQIRIIGEELFCDLYALKNITNKSIARSIMDGYIDSYQSYVKNKKFVIKSNMSLLRACNVVNYFPDLKNELTTNKTNKTNEIFRLLNKRKLNFNKLDNAINDFINSTLV